MGIKSGSTLRQVFWQRCNRLALWHCNRIAQAVVSGSRLAIAKFTWVFVTGTLPQRLNRYKTYFSLNGFNGGWRQNEAILRHIITCLREKHSSEEFRLDEKAIKKIHWIIFIRYYIKLDRYWLNILSIKNIDCTCMFISYYIILNIRLYHTVYQY